MRLRQFSEVYSVAASPKSQLSLFLTKLSVKPKMIFQTLRSSLLGSVFWDGSIFFRPTFILVDRRCCY